MTDDITTRSAADIAAAVSRGEVTAAAVLDAFLARVNDLNPVVNAICTPNPSAKADAADVDRRRRSGQPARPLEGVPFVVKDNLHTKGLRTTFGSKILEDHVPTVDSIAVERLREAGGVLLGKANTPEFAHDVNTTNKIFGTTRNPWDLRTTAGGSSGGTGAAVAAGLAPIGLGTDLGGSIRIPASFCGIAGLRPVPGRVPVYPSDFGWDTLVEHVHGPIARTVQDLGLMLSVLAGPDDRDPTSMPSQGVDFAAAARGRPSLEGRRIAYSANLNGLAPVDTDVAARTREATRRFERLGCTVTEECFDVHDLREIVAGTRAFGMIARYADLLEAHRAVMTDQLINQVSDALKVDARTITRAERARTAYWHRAREFFTRYDYFLTPTVGSPAFRLDQPLPAEIGGVKVERFYDVFLFTYAFSITGLPVASVPCGLTSAGLPVGLQIVGRRLREDLVLEAAAAYAAECPEFFSRPAIRKDAAPLTQTEVVTGGFPIR